MDEWKPLPGFIAQPYVSAYLAALKAYHQTCDRVRAQVRAGAPAESLDIPRRNLDTALAALDPDAKQEINRNFQRYINYVMGKKQAPQ